MKSFAILTGLLICLGYQSRGDAVAKRSISSHALYCSSILGAAKTTVGNRKKLVGAYDHEITKSIFGDQNGFPKIGSSFQYLVKKSGNQLVVKSSLEGPLLLLHPYTILRAPPGTILWTPTGDRYVLGSQQAMPYDLLDGHWGVRPLSHEFSQVNFPAFKPEVLNLNADQNLARFLLQFAKPDLFDAQRTEELMIESQRQILAGIQELTYPIERAFKYEALKARSVVKGLDQAMFWRSLQLFDAYKIGLASTPEMFAHDSPDSLVEIYRLLRTIHFDLEDPFEVLKKLKKGVRYVEQFENKNARGPLLLLTKSRIERLPPGTVLWTLEGRFQILSKKQPYIESDYDWGIRPLAHEFDNNLEVPKFKVEYKATNLQQRVALYFVSMTRPDLLESQLTKKKASRAERQVRRMVQLFVTTISDRTIEEIRPLIGGDMKHLWKQVGVYDLYKAYPAGHTVYTLSPVDAYLRMRMQAMMAWK